MRYLLDTNVLSEFSRPRPDPHVAGWFLRQFPGDLVVSAISVGEIQKGVLLLPPGKKRAAFARWLEDWVIEHFQDRSIPVDIPIGREWGRHVAESIRSGRSLSFADALLLATATDRNLVVVTRNERDFRGRGVHILNPWNGEEP